jgi:hypothetical protein
MSYAQSLAIIAAMNHARDSRVRNAGDRRLLGSEEYMLEREDGTRIVLPTKWEVCSACGGEGEHVAPGIDSSGLTASDFEEDPDFAEDYAGGHYDVTCQTCHGRSTVRIVDVNALSPEIRAEYQAQCDADRQYEAECMAELRAGC